MPAEDGAGQTAEQHQPGRRHVSRRGLNAIEFAPLHHIGGQQQTGDGEQPKKAPEQNERCIDIIAVERPAVMDCCPNRHARNDERSGRRAPGAMTVGGPREAWNE